MKYKGYKIRVRCIDWEQEQFIGAFWDYISPYTSKENIIGLGMNWTDDYLYFDYALGVIDDENTLQKLNSINFTNSGFSVEYIEIELPSLEEWTSFKGKTANLKEIYDVDIDCYNKKYDYELEYIDGNGNLEIKIHFIDN